MTANSKVIVLGWLAAILTVGANLLPWRWLDIAFTMAGGACGFAVIFLVTRPLLR